MKQQCLQGEFIATPGFDGGCELGQTAGVDAWIMFPAGVFAGVINAVAGGGSLLTFPVLIALGYSPLVANVTNAIGVFTSNLGGAYAYREELQKSAKETFVLCAVASIGALGGAVLLLNTGESIFEAIVPWLIGFASLLILLQPLLARRVTQLQGQRHFVLGAVAVALVAIYGGYFGAAMGVLFLAAFGSVVHESLSRLNAKKNAVAMSVNGVCVVVFTLFAPVAWGAAISMAIGTLIGGLLGGRLAKRLPDRELRLLVVVVGLIAAIATVLS